MTRRQFLALILPLVGVLLGFVALLIVEGAGIGGPPWDEDFAFKVRERMGREFVWGIPDGRRAWEAYFNSLNEYVRTFDHYGEVVPPWAVAASRELSTGLYVGIGIRIQQSEVPVESVPITGVHPKGPASEAGIKVGDAIVSVNGHRVADMMPDDLQRMIRGEEGSTARLGIRDPKGAERVVTVKRARISTGSVFGARIVDEKYGIAYFRLEAFKTATSGDVRRTLLDLRQRGMKALVLDLRENGGGLLDEAIAVADLFLSEGVIVRQRGRREEFTVTYEATAKATIAPDLPMAVLINERSASASEILATALQDHRRAVLVGVPTYGKFLVQIVEEMPMEIGTALFKRTTSIYESPLGHHYARTKPDEEPDPMAGVPPDVYVPIPKVDVAKLVLRGGIFEQEKFAAWNPNEERVWPDFVDTQLEAGVALLRGEMVYPRILPRQ